MAGSWEPTWVTTVVTSAADRFEYGSGGAWLRWFVTAAASLGSRPWRNASGPVRRVAGYRPRRTPAFASPGATDKYPALTAITEGVGVMGGVCSIGWLVPSPPYTDSSRPYSSGP